jgi:hypothetical protein
MHINLNGGRKRTMFEKHMGIYELVSAARAGAVIESVYSTSWGTPRHGHIKGTRESYRKLEK